MCNCSGFPVVLSTLALDMVYRLYLVLIIECVGQCPGRLHQRDVTKTLRLRVSLQFPQLNLNKL